MLKSGFFKNPASFFDETNLPDNSESTLAASENDLGGFGAGDFGDGFTPHGTPRHNTRNPMSWEIYEYISRPDGSLPPSFTAFNAPRFASSATSGVSIFPKYSSFEILPAFGIGSPIMFSFGISRAEA